MAFSHIQIGTNSTHGPRLLNILSGLKNGHQELANFISIMQTMIDGDGSQAAHFVEVTARLGTQSDAQSKALFDELNSVNAKLHTDAAVTFVDAAIRQVLSKCG